MLLFAACAASSPDLPRVVTVTPETAVRIVLTDVKNDRSLAVQNAAASAARRRADSRAVVKVVRDEDLQTLLDVLAEKGLFEHGTARPLPDAIDLLTVENGTEHWHWARRKLGVQAEEMAFHESRSYFLAVFNNAVDYRRSTVDRDGLEAEQQRVKQGESPKRRSGNQDGPR